MPLNTLAIDEPRTTPLPAWRLALRRWLHRYQREIAFAAPFCACSVSGDDIFLLVLNCAASLYFVWYLRFGSIGGPLPDEANDGNRAAEVSNSPPAWSSLLYVLLVCMVGYFALSHFRAPTVTPRSSGFYLCMGGCLLSLTAFAADVGRRDMACLERGLRAIFWVVLATAAVSFVLYLLNMKSYHVRTTGFGSLGNPNLLGPACCLGAILFCERLQRASRGRPVRWTRSADFWAMTLLLFFAVMTNSRSALLPLLIVLAVGCIMYRNKLAGFTLAIVPAFEAVRLWCVVPLTWRVHTLAQGSDAVPSLTRTNALAPSGGRWDIWSQAIEAIAARPWFGHGLGSGLAFEVGPMTMLHPHNVHLSALAFGGVVGGAMFLTAWGLALWVGWRAQRGPQGHAWPLAWVGYAFVCTQFDHCMRLEEASMNWLLVWMPLAFAAAWDVRLRAARLDTEQTLQGKSENSTRWEPELAA